MNISLPILQLTILQYYILPINYLIVFKFYSSLEIIFNILITIKDTPEDILKYLKEGNKLIKNCLKLKSIFLDYKRLSFLIENIDLLKNDKEISSDSLRIFNLFNYYLRKNIIFIDFFRKSHEILFLKNIFFILNISAKEKIIFLNSFNNLIKRNKINFIFNQQIKNLLKKVIKRIYKNDYYFKKLNLLYFEKRVGFNLKFFKHFLFPSEDFLLKFEIKIFKNLINNSII